MGSFNTPLRGWRTALTGEGSVACFSFFSSPVTLLPQQREPTFPVGPVLAVDFSA